MTYTIRKANNDDSTSLTKLMISHAEYEGHNLTISHQQQKLSHLADLPGIIFVVESQGKLFGYMSVLEQFSTWDMDWYIYLDCLYLGEQTRGQGVGLALMLRLQQYANHKGITHIQWQTPNDNLSAIGFYKKLGAVSKHKQRFFWSV